MIKNQNPDEMTFGMYAMITCSENECNGPAEKWRKTSALIFNLFLFKHKKCRSTMSLAESPADYALAFRCMFDCNNINFRFKSDANLKR